MNLNSEPIIKAGQFCIGSHENLRGELSLQGRNSALHIEMNNREFFKSEFFKPEFFRQDIVGILDDQEKISLIKCIRNRIKWAENSCKFFPCYVIIGDHLHEFDKVIEEVSFVVDDADVLFGSQNSSDNLEVFSIETDTNIERISAYISMTNNQISNKAWIRIKFRHYLNIKEVDEKIDTILRFLEIIAGRPQNVLEVKIKIKDNPEQLSSYLNSWSSRIESSENPKPSCDVLMNAANQREKFETLISKWLERDEDDTWQIARQVFSEVWNKQRKYDPYRIIAAAIMFEVLPKGIFSKEIEISRDFQCVIKEIEELIRPRLFNVQVSIIQKDCILNSLRGCHINLNVSKLKVKQKIKLRLQSIIRQVENSEIAFDLHQLDCVVDKAIDLRNFYIHSDDDRSGRSREGLKEHLRFFTKTLEFIFCVSDLIDLEWDFLSWYEKCKITHQTHQELHPLTRQVCHPFSDYVYNYKKKLEELKKCLAETT